MSSASVIGRCKMTVPAAEKMTTKIMRITPVLMELSVCQRLRHAERNDRTISFLFLASCNARSAPTFGFPAKSFVINGLSSLAHPARVASVSHITHLFNAPLRIDPLRQVCDFNHKGLEIYLERRLCRTTHRRAWFHRASVAEGPFAGARVRP